MSEQIAYIPMEEPIFGPHPEGWTGPGGATMLPPPVSFPEYFHSLPTEGKYQFYKEKVLGTAGRRFASREAAREYRSRMQRWYDAIELKEPDRVPSYIIYCGYIATHTGVSEAENFYDTPKAARAALQFHEEFEPDYATMPNAMPGGMYDLLGTRMIRWPGGSRSDSLRDDVSFQYVEGEYMKRDEYAALIQNPEGFMLRTWYPRVFGNLKGLAHLPSFFTPIEPPCVISFLMHFAAGPAREAINSLLAAADSCLAEMMPAFLAVAEIQRRWGAANLMGAVTLVPFDIIGDTLRGTKGVMLDMFRQPDALLEACDAVTPAAIRMATESAMASGQPFVFMPLHKCDDSFMSEAQFARFYWPSFKKMLDGIIDAGLIPHVFAEGNLNNKLDVIAGSDLPKGKVVWMFDRTDVRLAKSKLGGKACVGGSVPSSLFAAGTGQQMDDFCRQLLEDMAPGGGFVLTPSSSVDHAKPETIRAFIQSTRKYGG